MKTWNKFFEAKGPDVSQQVEKAVRSLQVALNDGDAAAVRKYFTDDHVAVMNYKQYFSPESELKELTELKTTSYDIKKLRVISLAENVALAIYQADVEATYRGKKTPSNVYVMATWVYRNGKWLEASYQETPI